MTPAVGQIIPPELAEAEIVDAAGLAHTVASRWASGDCLIVFVRRYACVGCAEHLTALRPRLDEIAQLGVERAVSRVVRGQGDPVAARSSSTAPPGCSSRMRASSSSRTVPSSASSAT